MLKSGVVVIEEKEKEEEEDEDEEEEEAAQLKAGGSCSLQNTQQSGPAATAEFTDGRTATHRPEGGQRRYAFT